MVVNFVVVVMVQCLVAVVFVVILGLLALVGDFREVFMNSLPKLAHRPPRSLDNVENLADCLT